MRQKQQQQQTSAAAADAAAPIVIGRILVLHGNRQTGDLLLGRMAKLQSTLKKHGRRCGSSGYLELVALDAPFLYQDDPHHHHHQTDQANQATSSTTNGTNHHNPNVGELRTWWHRQQGSNSYQGLAESIDLVRTTWNQPLHQQQSPAPPPPQDNDDGQPPPFVSLLGFSQGARLVHLLATLQDVHNGTFLPGLRSVVMVAGYAAPWPDHYPLYNTGSSSTAMNGSLAAAHDNAPQDPPPLRISVPSLHVWGTRDALIAPQQSRTVTNDYVNGDIYEHDSGHCVPMRAHDVRAYVDFLCRHQPTTTTTTTTTTSSNSTATIAASLSVREPELASAPPPPSTSALSSPHTRAGGPIMSHSTINQDTDQTMPGPDDEQLLGTAIPEPDVAEQQRDEVEAIQAIYPDEFTLVSATAVDSDNDTVTFTHPIVYTVQLVHPTGNLPGTNNWPARPVRLHVTYPPRYPGLDAPILRLLHDNNGLEFTSRQTAACLQAIQRAAAAEHGMPCILSCLLAAQDYMDSPRQRETATPTGEQQQDSTSIENPVPNDSHTTNTAVAHQTLMAASADRIRLCQLQGLDIADALLPNLSSYESEGLASRHETGPSKATSHHANGQSMVGKGGSWSFCIGLVGKPSAGKSTFFNTATGFARQRDAAATAAAATTHDKIDVTRVLGGAAMAPHPFTTIEPNTGYALVPAPYGSCPEDNLGLDESSVVVVGSTHGRDSDGRRLLPVLLKDVAGLVPGAYQGRGRGNQFLNDLCDADVLIHVCDASGMSDTEGNMVGVVEDTRRSSPAENLSQATAKHDLSHPLNDMAWIRNELIEWVFTNITLK
jgi:Serine hydrolase (FSH1)/RWD domain/50S ribosome-binding GTPase